MKKFSWVLVLWLSACGYHVDKEKEKSQSLPASLGFNEVNAMVFTPHCLQCHGRWVGSYEDTIARLDRISTRLQSDQMGVRMPPAGGLSENEKAAVLQWIAQGAPLEAAPSTPPQQP